MPGPSPLAIAHRDEQLQLRNLLLAKLLILWPAMDWTQVDVTYPAWRTSVESLIREGHSQSSSIAAAFYQAHRAHLGVPGHPVVVIAPQPTSARMNTSLRVTSAVSIKAAATRGVSQEAAMGSAFVASAGAATRFALEGGRQTLLLSADADPQATGWQRVTDPGACDFCQELAAYADQSTYGANVNQALSQDFVVHDHCGCSVEVTY